ncbi:MAG TPA: cytochrome c oxidase subunit 3 family protein [Bacteroidales bacterium]|jgi:cytochrome c oxidase subunit 3|nr:cytochrome c oxidase subunit 3 family protein [Bacteroidales bacterium]
MITIETHRDDLTSKFGMWLFLYTEMLLFGGLFIVYSVYRYKNATAFHLAAEELSVVVGTINTIILLVSSATVAMSITAIRMHNKKLSLALLSITILLGLAFLVNKYFEWGDHLREHIFPGSNVLALRGHGDVLFYGLYYSMTGLHALHIIVGLVLIVIVTISVAKEKINSESFVFLENGGLYWHLVDLIWIFLFPLFYLIT